MHRAARNIVLRCPSIYLTLADVSIAFGDNGILEGSLGELQTILLAQNRVPPGNINDWGNTLFGQLFFRHADLIIIYWIAEI